jgi:hypothetical protein
LANTARLASRRVDLVPRLIALVVCFYLAIATPFAYALEGNPLTFSNIKNFVRSGGGGTADYFFKDYAGTTYSSKGHVVNTAKLGSVAFRRILGLTGYGLAAYAIYEIVTELQKDGWTVDPANQEIYKLDGGLRFFVDTNGFNKQYFPTAEAAIQNFLDARKVEGQPPPTFNSWRNDWPKPLDQLRVGEMIFRGAETSIGYYSVMVEKMSQTKQLATESDVAAVLPRVSDDQIAALLVSPYYLAEPHAHTIAAAAADKPETTTTPEPQKATLGTKKETVTTTNPDGTTTTTTTTTQTNPDGTPATNPDGTPKTPHVETTTTHPNGTTTTTTNAPKPAETETPAFCDWAKTLCSWLDWTKEEPASANPAQNKVDIKDRQTEDIPGLPTTIDTSRISWAQNCPAPISANFGLMGQSVVFSYKFDVVCDFAAKFRPYVIGLSYLTGAYIVMGLNRTRSE